MDIHIHTCTLIYNTRYLCPLLCHPLTFVSRFAACSGINPPPCAYLHSCIPFRGGWGGSRSDGRGGGGLCMYNTRCLFDFVSISGVVW